MVVKSSLFIVLMLAFNVPLTTIVVLEANVDQDQAAQNVHPNLRSTLSIMLELYR